MLLLALSDKLLDRLRRFGFLDQAALLPCLTLRPLAVLLDALLDPLLDRFSSGRVTANLRRRFEVRSSATVLALSDMVPDRWLRAPRLFPRMWAEEVTFELRQLLRSLELPSVV